MTTELPAISVIIPTFNEQNFIKDCILSLIHGNYPKDLLQIIVVDGMSTDATTDVVKQLNKTYKYIELIPNQKKIVPAAVNLGIANSSNEILVWVGAHATYDLDYLVNCVTVLQTENCSSVGGVIIPIGKSPMGTAIAHATSSKFGIGSAGYRHATHAQKADTVFGGCWRKTDILKVGGFNEKWVRNQDFELNYRLRTEIGVIILDPKIRCYYFCRDSIGKLARQYYGYGFWRFKTSLKHPATFSTRQLAPIMLLGGLVLSALALPGYPKTALFLPLIYLGASLITALNLAQKHYKPMYIFLMPSIFATIHLSWAIGFSKSAILHALKKF